MTATVEERNVWKVTVYTAQHDNLPLVPASSWPRKIYWRHVVL